MAASRHGLPPAALMSQISPLPNAAESNAISRLSGDHAGWNGRRDCAASSRKPEPSALPRNTHLNQEDLWLSEAQVRARGKGNKIRFLPLAPESIQLLDHYLRLERPSPSAAALFVSLKGRARVLLRAEQ
jgi:hypothetical protein